LIDAVFSVDSLIMGAGDTDLEDFWFPTVTVVVFVAVVEVEGLGTTAELVSRCIVAGKLCNDNSLLVIDEVAVEEEEVLVKCLLRLEFALIESGNCGGFSTIIGIDERECSRSG
jgi:hypothetical protein